jgi:hypothetical protein
MDRAPDALHLTGSHCKGFTVRHMLEVMQQLHGHEAVLAFCQTLPKPMADPILSNTVLPIAWLPLETYFLGVRFMVERFHGGDPKAAIALGKQIARADIGAFFRVALSVASPNLVVGLSSRFFRNYYDRGVLEVVGSEPGHLTGRISGWPLTDAVTIHEFAGGLLAWCEASRGKDVRLERVEVIAPETFEVEVRFS